MKGFLKKLSGNDELSYLSNIPEYERYFGSRVISTLGDNSENLWKLYKKGKKDAFFKLILDYISNIPDDKFDILNLSQLIDSIGTSINSHAKEESKNTVNNGFYSKDRFINRTNTINKEIHLAINGESRMHLNIVLKDKTDILVKCIQIQALLYLKHADTPPMSKSECINFIQDILLSGTKNYL